MKKGINPTAIISLGFLGAIIIGSLLLMLPIAQAAGADVEYIDALFTATSAVCVTGLLTVPIYSTWSVLGQVIIFGLIEVGGLGIITFTTIFMIVLGRRIGIKQRVLIQNAYNLDSSTGMVKLVKRIFKGTLIVEAVGALVYMPVFIPRYGASGIWMSVFTSASAFCNAGMDLIGENSLMDYVTNPIININTMILIVLGGIGFPVWWYFVDSMPKRKSLAEIFRSRHKSRSPLFVKMVVSMSVILIVFGALVTFIFEYTNPDTIGSLSLGGKIMASFFQSVTWRTAGFATISQSALYVPTMVVGCVLMFIGGSPSGTAGGIKTTTIMIILASVVSMLKEKNDTEIFHRKIKGNIVRRALAIFMVSFITMIISLFFMSAFQDGSLENILYEVVSALGTVGLSRDFTPILDIPGKIIIICTMFMGRIGPISLSMFFNTRKYDKKITYAEERVSVG